MSRTKSIIVCVILIAVGIVGAWLVGLFEGDGPRDISGLEFLSVIFGFVLFLAALIGIVLVIRQNIGPMSESDISEWEIVRKRGKRSYVRKGLLKGILFGLLGVLFPLISVINLGLPVNSLWILGVVLLTGVLGGYYAAIKKWDSNEKDYEALVHSKLGQAYDSPPDYLIEDEPLLDVTEDETWEQTRKKGLARFVIVNAALYGVSGVLLTSFTVILLPERFPLYLPIAVIMAGMLGGATAAIRQWNWHERKRRSLEVKTGSKKVNQ